MTTYRERLDAGDYAQGTTLKRQAFVCEDCGKKLTSEHGLKIHRTKAHGANGNTERDTQPLEPIPDEADTGAF